MKKQNNVPVNNFKIAVENTPDVRNGYMSGLSAFGKYSQKIVVPDNSKIMGSVDIDKETEPLYPNDNRWDYAMGYDGEVFYLEFHSAITSEVSRVFKKLEWLKTWLRTKAPEINKLTAKSRRPYCWIQSSNFQIPPTTSQYRLIISKGFKPVAKWDYSKWK